MSFRYRRAVVDDNYWNEESVYANRNCWNILFVRYFKGRYASLANGVINITQSILSAVKIINPFYKVVNNPETLCVQHNQS